MATKKQRKQAKRKEPVKNVVVAEPTEIQTDCRRRGVREHGVQR